MPVREYNVTPGQDKLAVARTTSLTAATGGATSLGGPELRVVIDDTAAPSKLEVLRALDVVKQRVLEDTWPQA